jgi:metaxin
MRSLSDATDVEQDQRPQTMTNPSNSSSRDWRDMFAVPPVIKQVFAQFPLSTYPSNALPTRSPTHRDQHTLYTWTTAQDARANNPSFNPTCLKWQTYLLFNGIPFRAQPSNNHASPSGSLPFLLPANSSTPLASAKLESWTSSHSTSKSSSATQSSRQEVYTSLFDHAIRRAWLYLLYLDPENFHHVAKRLYVTPSSSNTFVAMALSYQLRDAATQEIVKTTPVVKAEDILDEAVEAFEALSTLLGEETWFFGSERPTLFDACVFAYTHLLLDEGMGWRCNPLAERLAGFANLVGHRERILREYYR